MTLYEFEKLTTEEMIHQLFSKGKRIAIRSDELHVIQLYAISNFFVEVFVSRQKKQIILLTAITEVFIPRVYFEEDLLQQPLTVGALN